MKSVCQYDGIKLYRPVTDGEKKLFADMLVKRFQGDRYKSFLTFDDSSGDPIIAYVQVIDFLDPEHLLVGKSGCRWRFYLEPVAHCFLGKPESLYEAARKILKEHSEDGKLPSMKLLKAEKEKQPVRSIPKPLGI